MFCCVIQNLMQENFNMKKRTFTYFLLSLTLIFLVHGCSKEERPPDPVTDIDGNTYKTVRIGTQIFMSENLRTTRFNDGTDIQLVGSGDAWRALTTPAICWYANEETTNKEKFGALYNAYAIDSGKLCPVGWHVPSREEWDNLRDFLGDTLKGGGQLKGRGTEIWLDPNKGAENSSGFSATGAGIRYFEGSFTAQSSFTAIWSSTNEGTKNSWYLSLYFGDETVKMGHASKNNGFSVRCIKD